MTFEFVVYVDRLLRQVGLFSNRKGWFRDLFEPCGMRDLGGLRDEYLAKYAGGAASSSAKGM